MSLVMIGTHSWWSTTTAFYSILSTSALESLSNEDGNVNDNVAKQDLITEYNHFKWECNHLATFPLSSLETERENLNSGVL